MIPCKKFDTNPRKKPKGITLLSRYPPFRFGLSFTPAAIFFLPLGIKTLLGGLELRPADCVHMKTAPTRRRRPLIIHLRDNESGALNPLKAYQLKFCGPS